MTKFSQQLRHTLKMPGWEFTKLLTKIRKIFLNFKPKNLQINKAKSTFLKQISLKSDINYCNNHKIPIFHEKLRC